MAEIIEAPTRFCLLIPIKDVARKLANIATSPGRNYCSPNIINGRFIIRSHKALEPCGRKLSVSRANDAGKRASVILANFGQNSHQPIDKIRAVRTKPESLGQVVHFRLTQDFRL
ncbi:hypothetical protein A0U91_15910 (plasmid) [Acetobacter persici]|uniref:Uncharacterized protein n=1 Tax=Acetobacter persici TaxID=1076596 RepID=A0A1U9LJ64_9PROT|nr:hypothetical protein A0U91_15910 [Acetobacter persici]